MEHSLLQPPGLTTQPTTNQIPKDKEKQKVIIKMQEKLQEKAMIPV